MPIAHGLLGASIVAAVHRQPSRYCGLPLLAGAVLANLPDLDFIIVFIVGSRGWHRTFSHSLLMAAIVGLFFILGLGRNRWREAAAYTLAFASHGLLDFATTVKGGGVELFWPIWTERLKLNLIGLSEIPSHHPPVVLLKFVAVEFLLFTPLLLTVLGLRYLWSPRNRHPNPADLF